jgi:hypothetical protein
MMAGAISVRPEAAGPCELSLGRQLAGCARWRMILTLLHFNGRPLTRHGFALSPRVSREVCLEYTAF